MAALSSTTPKSGNEGASRRLNSAKFRIPGLTSASVVRARLLDRLNRHSGGLVLVSAPAGFGKTVLVADWVRQRSSPTVWLSLDALDNDPVRLAAHLGRALDDLGAPQLSEVAELVRRAGSFEGPARNLLGAALADVSCEACLILDDFHEIKSKGALALLDPFLTSRDGRLRLVVLSRTDPPMPLTRARLAGQLLELRATDLAFSASEATELMTCDAAVELSETQLRALVDRTEGWPAALRLAAIALADAPRPEEFVTSFTGTNRLVTDYLVEEAIGRQTPTLRQFLMESAVLSRFTADVCRTVLGDPESPSRLAEAVKAGLFLVPLGSDDTWYRYHHLFSELLVHRLALENPQRLDELRRRASGWFERNGDVEEAVDQAIKAGHEGRLLELADRFGLEMMGRGELGTLRRCFEHLQLDRPGPYPLAWAALAWLQVVTEPAGDPGPLISRIQAAIDSVDASYPDESRARALLHTKVLAAYAARYAHDWASAIALGDEADAELGEGDPLTRGFLGYNTARVHMSLGQMDEAIAGLERAYADHLRSGNLYLILATLGRSIAIRLQQEGVSGALEASGTALRFVRARGLVGHPALAIVRFHEGMMHLEAGDSEAAAECFEVAVDLADPEDFPEERGNALVGLARVAVARRDLAAAEDLLVEVSAIARAGNVDLFETTLAIERLRVDQLRWELEGKKTGPRPDRDLTVETREGGLWTVLRETAHRVAIRRTIDSPDESSLPLATRLLEESRLRGRGLAELTALLALAIARSDGQRWELLEEGLLLARERGYRRPIADLGARALSLLESALRQRRLSDDARDEAKRLLAWAAPGWGEERAERDEASLSASRPLLTDRELEVARLLFEGLTNKAMGRRLFVSVDTIKTHLKHIYAKLGVSNRSQATERVRQLGLQPERIPLPGSAD